MCVQKKNAFHSWEIKTLCCEKNPIMTEEKRKNKTSTIIVILIQIHTYMNQIHYIPK